MNNKTYPNLKQSVLLLFFFFMSFAVFFILTLTMPQLFGIQMSKLYLSTVFSLASPIVSIPLIIYIIRKSGIQLKWRIKLPGIIIIFLLVLLAISLIIITSPLYNPKEYFINLIDGKFKLPFFDMPEFDLNFAIRFICTVLIAPIFEEILIRKQILGLLLKKHSPVVSIVLSSILFALCHLRFNDICSLFIWGLLLGIVYFRTNSIEAAILLHSFWNCSVLFIVYKFIDITELQIFKYVSIMVCSLIAIFLITKYLGRSRMIKKDSERGDS